VLQFLMFCVEQVQSDVGFKILILASAYLQYL